jgi:hypothetical protein
MYLSHRAIPKSHRVHIHTLYVVYVCMYVCYVCMYVMYVMYVCMYVMYTYPCRNGTLWKPCLNECTYYGIKGLKGIKDNNIGIG